MEFSKYELFDLVNRPGPLCLASADLSGAKLNHADLRTADLRGANLWAVSLTKADLSEAFLILAKYNSLTKWPDGFDPRAAGAILVDAKGNPIDQDE